MWNCVYIKHIFITQDTLENKFQRLIQESWGVILNNADVLEISLMRIFVGADWK